jgi:hypothetical protein
LGLTQPEPLPPALSGCELMMNIELVSTQGRPTPKYMYVSCPLLNFSVNILPVS